MKVIELNLAAAKKRKSKQTGFIHHCYEDPKNSDTIPVIENFCYAEALLRSRLAENVLEGRALLEKLKAFEIDGLYPVYLHEYPNCRVKKPESIKTALPENWHPRFHAFIEDKQQEKGEPELTLDDLRMGQLYNSFSKRALTDHPVHLRASLIEPSEVLNIENNDPFVRRLSENTFKIWWGDQSVTHTFALFTKGKLEKISEEEFLIYLPEEHLEEEALEIKCFLNMHEENKITMKASTFKVAEVVEISSKELKIELSFYADEGNFLGHISHGNRPHSKNVTIFDAYDWQIALRSIRRPVNSIVRAIIKITS